MEFLTIKDVAEKSGLPKPTVYRMFHEMGDFIPHKRIGRKILFPRDALDKIAEIRRLTKEEGLTYKMIRDEAHVAPQITKSEQNEITENTVVAQLSPRISEALSRGIAAGFEGLREDLRLLAAQIDRQNDLLSRYLGQDRAFDELAPSEVEEEIRLATDSETSEEENEDWEEDGQDVYYDDQKNDGFRAKWSNFWAGRGWRA